MGKHFKYVSLDRILSKVYRDLGIEEISETDVIEWVGEALELINAPTLNEEAVAFIEVNNHKAELPNGLHQIIQVAKNNHWHKKEPICPANIILDCPTEQIVTSNNDCGCGNNGMITDSKKLHFIPLDCQGEPIFETEVAYYRPYFDLQYEYFGWNNSNIYSQQYTPMRLANHTFFNSLVCEEQEHIYCKDCGVSEEYSLRDNTIITSFQEGSIALSYYRQKVDEKTGYPMIPDEISIITAITYYITWKYMQKLWYMGREGYGDKMQFAQAEWHWYCKQAGNKLMIPNGIDEHQNIMEATFQLIPRRDMYYGFFGKLGRPEYTDFKNPAQRSFNLRGNNKI